MGAGPKWERGCPPPLASSHPTPTQNRPFRKRAGRRLLCSSSSSSSSSSRTPAAGVREKCSRPHRITVLIHHHCLLRERYTPPQTVPSGAEMEEDCARLGTSESG